ncbi:M28 family peptidase [Hymenobacter metallicola]|uniref:M20/M25/M40 family metallo-hydrolase n=1 Tax=Hymenobacter metallicola TaxID=2563114 RepID=A0A4Z0QCW4_9BACT|nr:M28 family peptidase [Hymenobacter metallicola]TGE27928.1 M20/M25/M40 family metallo-hydrolase [Hymenobacter metallicola]
MRLLSPHALLLVLSSLVSQVAPAQALKVDKKVAKVLKQVRPDDVKAHIQYLADDKLLGRRPGTPGYQMAVDYVTGQLKSLGVQPAGDNGSYVQRVRLRKAFSNLATTTLLLRTGAEAAVPLAAGKEFVLYPHPEEASVTLEAPLVFAGYGISAPELQYDDYAGLDAQGKIVVVVRGAPQAFPSTVAAASQDVLAILQNAARHGAVGVLLASRSAKAPLPSFKAGVFSVLGEDGKTAASRTFAPGIKALGVVNAATLHTLFRAAAADTGTTYSALRNGKPASLALRSTARLTNASTYQDLDSYNVVGKFSGSDARLQNEYVVHSAHLDHLGVGAPVKGDSIYNGAHDNASGVASVLEIARLYARLPQKPKRSVLFVLQTGEELGLLGSAYFAARPTVPKDQIVADINTDMPTIIAPLLSVVPLGVQHSTLAEPTNKAAAYLGLTVEADPEPEQNRFIRSDQYSFVMQGIPALHIKYGNKTADGKNDLSKTVQAWRAATYHKPQDDMSGTFDFEAGKKYVQLNFLIGYQVAQAEQRPSWNPGDFFGTRFSGK